MSPWPAAVVLLLGTAAQAEPVTLAGITFSDAVGGFVLEGGSGTGTLDDPFMVTERVTGDGPAVLTVSGLAGGFGNRVGTHHALGFALTKIVVNATADAWLEYRIELQEVLGRDSSFGDGLSFGQGAAARAVPAADRFADVRTVDEPLDSLVFSDGGIGPGAMGAFRFVVTDASPVDTIYIVQRALQPIALQTRTAARDSAG